VIEMTTICNWCGATDAKKYHDTYSGEGILCGECYKFFRLTNILERFHGGIVKSEYDLQYEKEPDELKYVDDDIKEEFRNTSYIIGVPTMIQLSRDIKNNIKVIE